jgi:hypothetical protein
MPKFSQLMLKILPQDNDALAVEATGYALITLFLMEGGGVTFLQGSILQNFISAENFSDKFPSKNKRTANISFSEYILRTIIMNLRHFKSIYVGNAIITNLNLTKLLFIGKSRPKRLHKIDPRRRRWSG